MPSCESNKRNNVPTRRGNPALLAESLKVIQKTAAVIFSALQTDTKEKEAGCEMEPGVELSKAS